MSFPIPEIKEINTLIKSYLKNDAKFLGYTAKLLNAPGENYGSLMLALEIKINHKNEDKIFNTVSKLCPPNEWIQRMFATAVTFKKEINFYKYMVPVFQEFQNFNPLGDIFPKCLGARINLNNSETVDEDAVLILDNLKSQGYSSGDRLIGFDFDEAKIILQSLARFHAVPLAYKIKNPEKFKSQIMPHLDKINIGQEMFDEQSYRFTESITRHLDLTADQLVTFENGMKKGYDFQKYFPSGNENYATTVHRDFWVNNTMILKQNGIPINNKIVDFQVITYGAPVTDLIFFIYTSIMKNVITQHYQDLLKIYHSSFVETLVELGCDVTEYSFESLKSEIDIYAPLEMSHILIMCKAVFADREAVKELTDFGIDAMFDDHGITEAYKDRLRWTVQQYFDKKWL